MFNSSSIFVPISYCPSRSLIWSNCKVSGFLSNCRKWFVRFKSGLIWKCKIIAEYRWSYLTRIPNNKLVVRLRSSKERTCLPVHSWGGGRRARSWSGSLWSPSCIADGQGGEIHGNLFFFSCFYFPDQSRQGADKAKQDHPALHIALYSSWKWLHFLK